MTPDCHYCDDTRQVGGDLPWGSPYPVLDCPYCVAQIMDLFDVPLDATPSIAIMVEPQPIDYEDF